MSLGWGCQPSTRTCENGVFGGGGGGGGGDLNGVLVSENVCVGMHVVLGSDGGDGGDRGDGDDYVGVYLRYYMYSLYTI